MEVAKLEMETNVQVMLKYLSSIYHYMQNIYDYMNNMLYHCTHNNMVHNLYKYYNDSKLYNYCSIHCKSNTLYSLHSFQYSHYCNH